MKFGLTNIGVNFQRAMDLAFIDSINKFVVIYLYDLTIFSNSDNKNLKHLRNVFDKCRKFGISLNPKKSLFSIKEGKLLGHIVSKEGVFIDPKRVSTIQALSLPRNKKEVQGFLGKIDFVRIFILNYPKIVKGITDMLRKGYEVKCSVQERFSFNQIKRAISKAPVVASLNYSKPFNVFSFASKNTLAVGVLQKNENGHDQPISFFSKVMRDAELKYEIIEK